MGQKTNIEWCGDSRWLWLTKRPQWEAVDLGLDNLGLDWVIQGGESGSVDRPFDTRWADDFACDRERDSVEAAIEKRRRLERVGRAASRPRNAGFQASSKSLILDPPSKPARREQLDNEIDTLLIGCEVSHPDGAHSSPRDGLVLPEFLLELWLSQLFWRSSVYFLSDRQVARFPVGLFVQCHSVAASDQGSSPQCRPAKNGWSAAVDSSAYSGWFADDVNDYCLFLEGNSRVLTFAGGRELAVSNASA